MKKLVSLLLAVCLMCGVCSAMAEETTNQMTQDNKTGTTEVSLTVAITDSYTVVIPAKVVIDPETRYGYGTITLQAGYVLGGDAQKIYVRLAGAANGIGSGYDSSGYIHDITETSYQNFTLKTEDGKKCTYAIKASNMNTPLHGNDDSYKRANLISATSTDSEATEKSVQLTYYVGTLPKTGVYTDTLTFEIVTE